ncbi:ATP-binding protein [Palleronia caenipelagi]|nr:ATP-binding protein [Palleronia caenipelagi]
MAVLISATLNLAEARRQALEEARERLTGYHEMMSYMVSDVDYEGAARIGLLLTQDPEIKAFEVVNRFGRIIAENGDITARQVGWLPVKLDITDGSGVRLANATYLVREHAIGPNTYLRIIVASLGTGALFAAFAFAIYIFLRARLLGPIRALHRNVIREGRDLQASEADAPLEIRELSVAIDTAFSDIEATSLRNRRQVEILTEVLSDFGIAIRHFGEDGQVQDYGISHPELAADAPGAGTPSDAVEEKLRSLRPPGFTVRELKPQITAPSHTVFQLEYSGDGSVYEMTLIDLGQNEHAAVIADVTHARALQKSAQEAQKMEVIGQLSSGVAHDFNNILGVILANAQLLEAEQKDSRVIRHVTPIITASERGATLTRSLLSFARESHLDAVNLDLNRTVHEITNWSSRIIPENISIEVVLQSGAWHVSADAAMTESALLNLMLNARDAMPNGGEMTIETANVVVDENYIEDRQAPIRPGRYTMLAVSDTGSGIDQADLDHIFEPFFTTKPPGKGSGLGLSMVHGFMHQTGGLIRAYSETGIGTTFKLFFPALSRGATRLQTSIGLTPTPTAGAHILLVEDEPALRLALSQQLRLSGYQVSAAENADTAEAMVQDIPSVDVVLTDIVMPGQKTGPDLVRTLRRNDPSLRYVFMSGYPQEASVHGNGLRPEDIRLMKPIRRDDLIIALEKALRTGSDQDIPNG